MKRDIGNMVKLARNRAGMMQSELGSEIGLSASSVSELEGGNRTKSLPPEDMVRISDALHDMELLQSYCTTCPLRKRISIRKFTPLNSIIPGSIASAVKNVQKLSEAAETLSRLLPKMLTPGFEVCPDFIEFRNTTVIKAIDVRRGLEILFDQLIKDRILSESDLKSLEDVQQRLCEAKGYHKVQAEPGV